MYITKRISLPRNSLENSIRCFIKALHDGTKKHYGVYYCLTLVKGRGKRRAEWGQHPSYHTWSWPVWLFVFLSAELQNIHELNTNIKPINASNKFFNLLKLFFNVAISTSFGNFGIPELKPSTPLFSYQYLSPSFRSLNCCPIMQENKAPTLAPSCGISAIPPAYTSISSTSLQVNVSMFSRFLWKSLLKV